MQTFHLFRIALFAVGAFALSQATAWSLHVSRRRAFTLFAAEIDQHKAALEAAARHYQYRTELQATREAQLASTAARGVQDLTIGYIGNQAANSLHSLLATYSSLYEKLASPQPPASTSPVSYREELLDLHDSLTRLKRVLADVLSHQRLVGGRIRLRLRPCLLRPLMQAFAERMVDLHHAPVMVDLDPLTPSAVLVDGFRIEQVLANGVANAVQALAAAERARGRSGSGTPADRAARPPVVIAVQLLAAPTLSAEQLSGVDGIITSADHLASLAAYSSQRLAGVASGSRSATGSRAAPSSDQSQPRSQRESSGTGSRASASDPSPAVSRSDGATTGRSRPASLPTLPEGWRWWCVPGIAAVPLRQ